MSMSIIVTEDEIATAIERGELSLGQILGWLAADCDGFLDPDAAPIEIANLADRIAAEFVTGRLRPVTHLATLLHAVADRIDPPKSA